MKKLFIRALEYMTKMLKDEELEAISLRQEVEKGIQGEQIKVREEVHIYPPVSSKLKENKKKTSDKSRNKIIREQTKFVKDLRDIRDIMELMEVPVVSISKNRTTPIVYESPNGKSRVKISCHPPYYIASIYDWDIILFVSSKLQESINSVQDIPPRTLVVPRNELIKSIYRHSGKTTDSEIEAALNRLTSTLIETTIHNEDHRHRSGFSFLDSWRYTDRKDIKEFRITLSEWLYEITCCQGSLLKVEPEYFKITSGFKRFLYRTARKHVGNQNEAWTFSIERLYEKSASEQEFKKFKYDLKKAVKENDIIGYLLEWIEEDGKTLVRFVNFRKLAKKELSSSSVKNIGR